MNLVRLDSLFEISYGNSFDLTFLEECGEDFPDKVNYVSRTRENNGVSAFVRPVEEVEPFASGLITVAGSGNSVLETFIQPSPFYTGYHVFVLHPIVEMTELETLFYCFCIKQNRYKYSYGRQANKTLKDILVPKEMPEDFASIDLGEVAALKSDALIAQDLEFDNKSWEWFDLTSVFTFNKCKCFSATELLESGDDIYYIGAKKSNNGVMQRVEYVEELVSEGNCIVFIGDGQGSVGYSIYQPNDFIGSTTLTCGYNPDLNKYNALFLVTVLDLERFKYSFGRKYGKQQLLKAKIKLPARNGEPDFEFMENYIKSLPYSASI